MSSPQVEEALKHYAIADQRRSEGNSVGAAAAFSRAISVAGAAGEPKWEALFEAELGRMFQDDYEVDRARPHYGRAIELFRTLDDKAQLGLCLFHLGQVDQLAGQSDSALAHFHEALQVLEQVGYPRGEALTRAALGQLLWTLDRIDEGLTHLVAALTQLRECEAPEAEHVKDHTRYWGGRLPRSKYQALVHQATSCPTLRSLLLD